MLCYLLSSYFIIFVIILTDVVQVTIYLQLILGLGSCNISQAGIMVIVLCSTSYVAVGLLIISSTILALLRYHYQEKYSTKEHH